MQRARFFSLQTISKAISRSVVSAARTASLCTSPSLPRLRPQISSAPRLQSRCLLFAMSSNLAESPSMPPAVTFAARWSRIKKPRTSPEALRREASGSSPHFASLVPVMSKCGTLVCAVVFPRRPPPCFFHASVRSLPPFAPPITVASRSLPPHGIVASFAVKCLISRSTSHSSRFLLASRLGHCESTLDSSRSYLPLILLLGCPPLPTVAF